MEQTLVIYVQNNVIKKPFYVILNCMFFIADLRWNFCILYIFTAIIMKPSQIYYRSPTVIKKPANI